MKAIWILTKRELSSFFDSLIAYILIILFLGLTGYFTWFFPKTNIFFINQASLQVFFSIASLTVFIFSLLITMRSLAEEKKSGTIELLSTKPITDWQIVMGKFLSSIILIAIALLCSIPYYFSVSILGSIDNGSVIGGYLGLLLMSASFISLGIFSSSLTNNQIVAFLISFFCFGIIFYWLFGWLSLVSTGFWGSFFNYMDINTHFESISRGVIDSRDIIYFLSIIIVSLFSAQTMLSMRNWHN